MGTQNTQVYKELLLARALLEVKTKKLPNEVRELNRIISMLDDVALRVRYSEGLSEKKISIFVEKIIRLRLRISAIEDESGFKEVIERIKELQTIFSDAS